LKSAFWAVHILKIDRREFHLQIKKSYECDGSHRFIDQLPDFRKPFNGPALLGIMLRYLEVADRQPKVNSEGFC
jgi:hypothetical protein